VSVSDNKARYFGQDIYPPYTEARIDPPVPDGPDGWYQGAVEVRLQAMDDISGVDRTFYRLDGGSWQVYAQPLVLDSGRERTVAYYSVDLAGNVEPEQVLTLKIDLEPATEHPVYLPLVLRSTETD